MVAVTVLVAVVMTETVLEPKLAAYAEAPFGVISTSLGDGPTGTVATTVLLAVPITTTALVARTRHVDKVTIRSDGALYRHYYWHGCNYGVG